MEDLRQQALDIERELNAAIKKLDITSLTQQKAELDEQIAHADFWRDAAKAQETMKQQAKLEQRIQPWLELQKNVADLLELLAMNDQTMRTDLSKQVIAATDQLAGLKADLKFMGPYDGNDVIVSIYAGAGGADAQDWTQMLRRMYVRWAESHNYQVKTIDESTGESGGIKSVTFEIDGDFLFGKLKGEHGVHRLVRLSPFNAESRETSFAKVDVLPKINRPEDLAIDEKDLRVDVFRAGGHGGQSVNTTDSAVRVTHIPTGITVAIQNERSQLQNKETALTILRSKLMQLQLEQHKEKISELKGPNQSAEWGNQIRSYVLHPYKQVKDLRTKFETSDPDGVLGGALDPLIDAYLEHSIGGNAQI